MACDNLEKEIYADKRCASKKNALMDTRIAGVCEIGFVRRSITVEEGVNRE